MSQERGGESIRFLGSFLGVIATYPARLCPFPINIKTNSSDTVTMSIVRVGLMSLIGDGILTKVEIMVTELQDRAQAPSYPIGQRDPSEGVGSCR